MLYSTLLSLSVLGSLSGAIAKPVYTWGKLPYRSEPDDDQYGYNNCTTANALAKGASAKCQTLLVNGVQDFCLWGSDASKPVAVGDYEDKLIAYCLKPQWGARLIPPGTIKSAHMIRTDQYIQISGTGDLSKLKLCASNDRCQGGGELDPHGATNLGNPIGGLLFSTAFSGSPPIMSREWSIYYDEDKFSIRACRPSSDGRRYCPHIYDEQGAVWNTNSARFGDGFDSCKADVGLPPGIYGSSTFAQGAAKTPDPHPAPASSDCTTYAGIPYTTAYSKAKRSAGPIPIGQQNPPCPTGDPNCPGPNREAKRSAGPIPIGQPNPPCPTGDPNCPGPNHKMRRDPAPTPTTDLRRIKRTARPDPLV